MSLIRVARNVSDLNRMVAFYQTLGFHPAGPQRENADLAALLGATHVEAVRLMAGMQVLELTACIPRGEPYPPAAPANARIFQHIALLVPDIEAAAARAIDAGATKISPNGPVQLPPESGGVVAWKFRDPDSHPLEFIQRTGGTGYDHSAIVVENTSTSLIFYETLGFSETHSQHNTGPAQERLDNIAGSSAQITTIHGDEGPGIELLGYTGVSAPLRAAATDIAADRLVIRSSRNELVRDPDGHFIQLENVD